MPIRFALADHVARVTIDRPEVLNAIDVASERELQALWARIEADPEVRVVVLTGTGERAFSAGADLKERSGASQLDYWATERPSGFGGIAPHFSSRPRISCMAASCDCAASMESKSDTLSR